MPLFLPSSKRVSSPSLRYEHVYVHAACEFIVQLLLVMIGTDAPIQYHHPTPIHFLSLPPFSFQRHIDRLRSITMLEIRRVRRWWC